MQFQLEAISLPGVLQANYILSDGDLQSCWDLTTRVFSLMYLRQKSYQLHTSFVVIYAIPLGITTATQDLESTSQAAIILSLSTMKSEFLCSRKTCGTSAKTYRNPEDWSQTKQLPPLFCSEPQTSSSGHFFNINSTFAYVRFMNSGYLVPPKVTVAEKGVSNLFQSTQKGSGNFTAVIWTELQPKSENWPQKRKLLHMLISQLSSSSSILHSLPLWRH